MSIRAKDGKWHYRFRLEGKRWEGSTGLDATAPNANAAKTIEAQKRLDVQRSTSAEPKRGAALTVKIASGEFLRWCHNVRYRQHPNSAKRIQTSFSSLNAFMGDRPVVDIEHRDVEQYKLWRIEEHGVQDVTLANDLNALSVFMGYCTLNKWRPAGSNPLKGEDRIQRPSRENAVRIHIITAEEEEAYFAHATGSVADVAKLMLLQGFRPDEVMCLRKTDYDREAGTAQVRFGKTKAAKRTLDLLPESVAILERRLKIPGRESSQWFFPSRHHQDKSRDQHVVQIDHSHDTVCRNANVSFVLYDFRHTFATRMLVDAGVDMASLASILGHSNMTILRKYVHPTAEHQASAMQKYQDTRRSGLKLVKKKIG